MPYRGMGDYGGRGDGFLGKLVKGVGFGLKLGAAVASGPAAVAMLRLKSGGRTKSAVAPIGGSTHGTVHTHDPAIDTFLRRGGRFSAAGRAKLTKQHAEALGVHPALAAHIGGRRRMNWANPRALGRAERRISSALKHFTRFFRWAHPGKSAGHAVPKLHHKGRKSR